VDDRAVLLSKRAVLGKGEARRTKGRFSADASRAPAARPDQGDDHVITRRDGPDTGAHAVHDPRRLVPVDSGKYAAPGAPGVRHVGVAHGTCHNADRHLARPGLAQLNVLDDQRRTELRAECRPHATASAVTLHVYAATDSSGVPVTKRARQWPGEHPKDPYTARLMEDVPKLAVDAQD